jgi:FimV-like protein
VRKVKLITLLLLSLMWATLSQAASLGSLNLSSSLGEPLMAEIEVQLEAQETLRDLQAMLASEQAYAQQGIPYQAYYGNIKVELQQKQPGQAVLRLNSSSPIDEAYLDVLMQLDWAAGRLQKHYIVLLDPPQLAEAEQEAIAAPLANGEAADLDAPLQTSMLPDQSPDQVDQTTPLILISKPGDTLFSLAKSIPQEGVSLDQMLLGLYQANPQAFVGGNMNRLKAGQTLALPSSDQLAGTPTELAAAEVKLHASNWQAYRAALASRVLSQAARPDAMPSQSATGKLASAKDDAVVAKADNGDVLKLSAGIKDAAKSIDAKVQALQEDATAREKSLQESEARAKALQKQIQDMQQLLQLKNQSMADLQKHATEAKQAQRKPKRAAWADWLVLSLTLLAIVAAFTWLSRSNKRRATLLDFKAQATGSNPVDPALDDLTHTQVQANVQAKAKVDPINTPPMESTYVPPVDLAGLDLNFTEPAVLEAKPADQPPASAKAKAKKKTGLTSFIKTDANEVVAADGDMEVIRIDLSSISLDLSETEDELTLANAMAPNTKTPNTTET